ncbi:MAG: glutathione S-transferase family protein [Verrucomicrobia bacterium]|nr:glutathione S-transferase family protein [Verrucomicrobiota bacterium]
MIELIQIPYSPYCLVQRRILEAARAPFRTLNVPTGDRSLVWRLTRQRYYAVPVLRDGRAVVFETDEDSQVIAKYLDNRLELGLFPREWAGVQNVLWRYFEHEIEGVGFKLNDIYYQENVPRREWLPFVRHKERKFGRGCLELWRAQQGEMLEELARLLVPCEQMLASRPFLLADRALFVDFNLYGMLANFMYSGHHRLPPAHTRLQRWYERLDELELDLRA